jgi:hypothetical protein
MSRSDPIEQKLDAILAYLDLPRLPAVEAIFIKAYEAAKALSPEVIAAEAVAAQRAADDAETAQRAKWAAAPEDFNGYVVTYYNHEAGTIDEQTYATADSVNVIGGAEGWESIDEEVAGPVFPDAERFAEDAFNIFGDHVGKVTDLSGKVLYDNMTVMNDCLSDF